MKTLPAILLLCICVFSCKNKEHNNVAHETEEVNPQIQEVATIAPVMAKLDASFIKMADSQKSVSAIEDKVWHYVFALSLKDDTPKENLYKGQWLDFLPNGHYARGIYSDTTEHGRFIYNEENTLLEMRSTKDTCYEWKIKYDPSNMILIGTPKYGNNPWQMKLNRQEKLPAKE
jgi:hypothetical protein